MTWTTAEEKIEKIAKNIYGAGSVVYSEKPSNK